MYFSLIWRYLKVILWIFLAIVVVVAIPLYFVKKRKKTNDSSTLDVKTPSIVNEVVSQVQVAIADVKIEHTVIKAKTKTEKNKLDVIKKERVGKKRRKKLAEYLKHNL